MDLKAGMGVAVVLSFAATAPAYGTIDVDMRGAPPTFRASVEACLEIISGASVETRMVIEALQNSPRRHVVQHSPGVLNTVPHNQANGDSAAAGGNGSGSGSTVNWDPTITDPRREGINDACVTLVHELRHAFEIDRGVGDMRDNDGNGIADEEEKASRTENRYRSARGHPQRRTYGGNPLPPWAVL